MQGILETLTNFWLTWGPWIGTLLIPTIIVGLTVSPKTQKAAHWVQKIWDVLKTVLDYVSVLSHKDKPGTFQMPFKLGDKLKSNTDVVLMLVLCGALVSSQASCGGWWDKNKEDIKQTAIDCTIDSVRTSASNLVPGIYGILTGGTSNWKDQISMFSKEFGRDAAACAVQAALQRLRDPIMSEPEEDPAAVAKAAAEKADAFIKEQGWTYSDK